MKAKYDLAVQGKQHATTKLTGIAKAKDDIRRAMDSVRSKLDSDCRALKQICHGFNLVDELAMTIRQMETEAKMLRSFDAKAKADEMIRALTALIDGLNMK